MGDIEHEQPRAWWRVKVACGAALIAILVDHYLYGLLPAGPSLPILLGQVIVIPGGLTTLYHYRILNRALGGEDKTAIMVCTGGLYPVLRHPMYSGDCLLYLGLFLLAPKPLGLGVLLLGWLALFMQAKAEDHYLAARFGETFLDWRQRSGLLLPGL